MMATKTSPSGSEVVSDARRYLGIRYVFGGGPANPQAGLDCSGLVERVAFDVGVSSCPRTSEQQWIWCTKVTTPGPGDLVFFVGADGEPGNPGHVGIVVSPGTMIDAPHTGTVVQQANYSTNGTGSDALVGYGKMPGVSPSTSANQAISATGSSDSNAGFEAIGGLISGLFVFGFFILIIIGIIFGAVILSHA